VSRVRKPKHKRPLAREWLQLDEMARGRVADRLLLGNAQATGLLRLAEFRIDERPDLAEKSLRKAAELYAVVKRLGYTVDGFDERIDAVARRLGLA
jgi:predicted nucleic acid-binding protein